MGRERLHKNRWIREYYREGVIKMGCPVCRGNTVGRVGTNQFYCWECFIEFTNGKEGTRIFNVEDDGTLVQIETTLNSC